jgi:DDE superfamily endonuclease
VELHGVAGAAKRFGHSRVTIRRACANGDRHSERKERRLAPATLKRRQRLKKLAQTITTKGDRSWPTYSGSRQLQAKLALEGVLTTPRTVIRDLHALGFVCRVRPRVPTRSNVHIQQRHQFSKNNKNFNAKHLVVSDETWLTSNEATGRLHWVFDGDEPLPVERKSKWNVASMMVWLACGYDYKCDLQLFPSKHKSKEDENVSKPFRLNGASYVRRCLSKVTPHLAGKPFVFLQDGARSHACKSTQAYLARKQVQWFNDFPPYSPDLNPAEKIVNELKRLVGKKCPMNMEELKVAALESWKELPQALINKHILNFSTRREAVKTFSS